MSELPHRRTGRCRSVRPRRRQATETGVGRPCWSRATPTRLGWTVRTRTEQYCLPGRTVAAWQPPPETPDSRRCPRRPDRPGGRRRRPSAPTWPSSSSAIRRAGRSRRWPIAGGAEALRAAASGRRRRAVVHAPVRAQRRHAEQPHPDPQPQAAAAAGRPGCRGRRQGHRRARRSRAGDGRSGRRHRQLAQVRGAAGRQAARCSSRTPPAGTARWPAPWTGWRSSGMRSAAFGVGFCLDTCHAFSAGIELGDVVEKVTGDHRPDRPGARQRQPRCVRLRRRPARRPRRRHDRLRRHRHCGAAGRPLRRIWKRQEPRAASAVTSPDLREYLGASTDRLTAVDDDRSLADPARPMTHGAGSSSPSVRRSGTASAGSSCSSTSSRWPRSPCSPRVCARKPAWLGLGFFLLLFGAIWLSWVTVVLYANVAAERAAVTTMIVATFLFAVMAAAAPNHFEDRANAFAVAFVLVRTLVAQASHAHRQAAHELAAAPARRRQPFRGSCRCGCTPPAKFWLWAVAYSTW